MAGTRTATAPESDRADFWLRHWSEPDDELGRRFMALTPVDVDDLLASEGLEAPGAGEDLKSLENQVFAFPEAEGPGFVLKLYRPGRWSPAALEDEIRVVSALAAAGLPVALPRRLREGARLGRWRGVAYTVLDRAPIPTADWRQRPQMQRDEALALGSLVARLHQVSSGLEAPHRPTLLPHAYAVGSRDALLRTGLLQRAQGRRLCELVDAMVARAEAAFAGVEIHPIHGDLHASNILWVKDNPIIIDFDDMLRGPPVQDLFLLAAGIDVVEGGAAPAPLEPGLGPFLSRRAENVATLVEGYRRVRALSDKQLALIPLLDAIRRVWMMAWLAHRRGDPCFAEEVSELANPAHWDAWLDATASRLDPPAG